MNDPYLILGLPPGTDDAAVRAAYLEGVRRYPPERDAERFAAVRRAYEALASERARLAHSLFDHEAPTRDAILHRLAVQGTPRRPAAAQLLAALKGGH